MTRKGCQVMWNSLGTETPFGEIGSFPRKTTGFGRKEPGAARCCPRVMPSEGHCPTLPQGGHLRMPSAPESPHEDPSTENGSQPEN